MALHFDRCRQSAERDNGGSQYLIRFREDMQPWETPLEPSKSTCRYYS